MITRGLQHSNRWLPPAGRGQLRLRGAGMALAVVLDRRGVRLGGGDPNSR